MGAAGDPGEPAASGRMRVVATAGHVDHGKSTLLRALTGMEPDRWAEERRRGMTIDLGFVWTDLPAGPTIAFVDVPGHERFVANTLAGVGPVPAALFVVAADEGWMPQSTEHLGALDALGVRHAILAVTRADLADPAPARDEALARITATSLGRVETVCVSAVTGAGLADLVAALERLVTAIPHPEPDGPVRLWVDRVFTVRGAGTVVTGTLPAGALRVGDELELDGGRLVGVRALQCLGRPEPEVRGVARVAVNLRGVGRGEVRRGSALVTPGRWCATRTVDVRLRGAAPRDLPGQVMFHIGSAATAARVRPLGVDTARLTLHDPLPLHVGDRGLVREPGTRHISGTTVLDVRPPALVRRGAGAARGAALSTMDGRPDGAGELRRRGLVRVADLVSMGVVPPGTPVAGDWLVAPGRRAALREELARAVAAHAQAHPLDQGMPAEAARQALGLPDPRLLGALVTPPLRVHGGRIIAGTEPTGLSTLPGPVRAAVDALRADLARAPFTAPDATRLAELGLHTRALAAAVRVGALLRVTDGVYLLPGADAEAARRLAELPQPFTVRDARQALGTTRRVAVPLLELLALQRHTDRLADGTHRLRTG